MKENKPSIDELLEKLHETQYRYALAYIRYLNLEPELLKDVLELRSKIGIFTSDITKYYIEGTHLALSNDIPMVNKALYKTLKSHKTHSIK
jgi:hypothetical protein